MQERKIFRSKAMESLSSPDEYDEPVKIVSVKSWVLFLLLFCASTAFITWVLFSNVNQEVRCIGIHLIPDRIYEVNSLSSGLIKRITAAKNTRIKAGDTLVEFISASTKEKAAILSAVDGSIFELNITAGDFINAGDKLMRIKKETGERNSRNSEISVFVPANSVGKIKKGGEVLISAASTDTKDPGFLSGRVSSVAEFPLSKERIGFLLKQIPSFGRPNYRRIL